MQKAKIIRRIIQCAVLLGVLILPIILVFKFYDSLFFQKVAENLSLESEDLLSCIIDYISIAVALLLGFVAYYQTKAINDLEFLKYNVFLGIEGVDYSISHNQPFEYQNDKKEFLWLQSVLGERKTLISYFSLDNSNGKGCKGKLIYIPLVFVARNEPLIVSIRIRTLAVDGYRGNEVIAKKKLKNTDAAYRALIHDGEKFNICLGIIAKADEEISRFQLKFDIIVEDHHGRKHKMQVDAILVKQSDGMFLTSSHTKCLSI